MKTAIKPEDLRMRAPMFTKPRAGRLSPARGVWRSAASVWRGSHRDIIEAANRVIERYESRPLPRA